MSRVPEGILRGRLSTDEEAEIISLAERRFSPGRVAQKLNRHPGTINFAFHRLGLRELKPAKFAYVRNGVEVRSFSPEEDAWITALRVQGYTTTAIAEMGAKRWGHPRTAATINMRLTMLANRSDAAAD